MTVTLLLAVADILTLVAKASRQPQASGPDAQQQLAAAAAALAQGVLSRRMKALYFNLSSEMRGKANAALVLLGALAAQGPETARQLARAFDFSLAALPALTRPPRQQKGDVGSEGAQVHTAGHDIGAFVPSVCLKA